MNGAPRQSLRQAFVASVCALGSALAFSTWLAWRELTISHPLASAVELSVEEGERFAVTASKLQAAGVVRLQWPLRLWARWHGLDRQVRAGDFRFSGAPSGLDTLAILCAPPNALVRVIIPEGTSLRGVAELLSQAGLASPEAITAVARDPKFLHRVELPLGAEGYLFPDTYEWPRRSRVDAVLHLMVRRFAAVAAPLEAQLPMRKLSRHQWVTLASLIEKETAVAAERRLVSAVFHNRLRIGMRLQSDPTAVYGRAEDVVPQAADLLIDTPYNTYLHAGLPPGPICNPGRAALEAALNPESVPFLYFVAKGDGGHEFSVSLDDHNRAVDRYRRKRRG